MPISPSRSASSRLCFLGALGLPIGHSMIVRFDLLSAAVGARPRHRRRADPERAVQQLRAARGPAVHPRRRPDEHRQPDRPAAAILPGAGRPLPRRARPRQRRRQHDLRRHVRLGHRRRRRHRPHHHRHDDARTAAIRSPMPARSPPRPPSSGRSFRRRSRWCSMRWSPTPRSATCSSAASSRASCSGVGFMIMNSIIARRRQLSGRAAGPAARDPAHHARARFPR